MVQFVEVDEGEPPEKLSAAGQALLARVRASGSVPLSRLADQWSTARSIVKKLEAARAVRVVMRPAPERSYFRDVLERDTPPDLTDAQKGAVAAIDRAQDALAPKTFLLHGVTGSGKTEVYLRAIAHARELGRGVDRARSGDRAHAAARRAVSRALRR